MKDLIGPYRIVRPLGQGGMGVVYLGIHDHLGREVAIKALAPELTQQPEFRERFFAEARVQARLQHGNIVSIYDLIEDQGSYFIVMEYLPGSTLEELRAGDASTRLDVGRSLLLFEQVLAGLDHAHSKGIIHRDVKPSNVLVAEGDLVKLTDFGIALLIGDKRLTASRVAIGTPIYMSPEHILRPRTMDHRADIYSAAVVLYEMLAGRPPFDAETEYEIKKLQVEAVAPDVRQLRSSVPEPVARALAVALAKNPDDRFQSAGAFLRGLREGSGDRIDRSDRSGRSLPKAPSDRLASVPPADLPAPPPPPRFAGRSRLALAAGAALLLAGLPLALFVRRAAPPPDQAEASGPPSPSAQLAEGSVPSANGTDEPSSVLPSRQEALPLSAERPVERNRPVSEKSRAPSPLPPPSSRLVAPVETARKAPSPPEVDSVRRAPSVVPPKTEVVAAPERIEAQSRLPAQDPVQAQVRDPRRLVLEFEGIPKQLSPGQRSKAVVRVSVLPSLERNLFLKVRGRVLRNLVEVGSSIEQSVTLGAGRDVWWLQIPVHIPPSALSGDCYFEVEVWEPGSAARSLKRIGFTIR